MRRVAVVVAVVLQFAVLAAMAGEREYVVRRGRVVYLRTAPMDPRDLFRGDYVRLGYEISTIPVKMFSAGVPGNHLPKGTVVYASLETDPRGVASLSSASLERQETGLVLRGRTTAPWSPSAGMPLHLRYGIEAYFVQQGTGRAMEKKRGERRGIQVPLEMEVALGSRGTAVIRGHRWSPLGIGLEVIEAPPRPMPGQPLPENARRSVKVRLTLQNASEVALALVDLPDAASFSLEPIGRKEWRLASAPRAKMAPGNENLIVLEPGAARAFEFDFAQPRWRVREGDSPPVEIGTLDWGERFRIVYMPPTEEACEGLERRELVWHGELPSRAFHGQGRID